MADEVINTYQLEIFPSNLTARQFNIMRSPKKNGTAHYDSAVYLKELGITIIDKKQSIQFLPNSNEPVHRWSPYVQGFSAKFVQGIFEKYKNDYLSPVVLDPFAGSGTVIVQAKLNGIDVYGIELNPLLHFVGETKINTWDTEPEELLKVAKQLEIKRIFEAPEFLKSKKHFNSPVLINLEKLKSGIDNYDPSSAKEKHIKNLLLLAFASILIECSNLKRTPCLGYSRSKIVPDNAPSILFNHKIREIAEDLRVLQYKRLNTSRSKSIIYLSNSMQYNHSNRYDIVITSPPYMNGLDYIMNYKIEMGWLGFAQNHKQLKKVKDDMVVCDNVSKGLIRNFEICEDRYTNDWIENIKSNIESNIARRGSYRRQDMPGIVHKYFDDMYKIMRKVINAINPNGRFVLVVGDSLIADVYVPTDLIVAKMGQEMGMTIESVDKARDRRSGQIRSYKLRESIVTLRKEK